MPQPPNPPDDPHATTDYRETQPPEAAAAAGDTATLPQDGTPPFVQHPGPAGLPRIPGYEVVREIARGGMGRVLLARDLTLGRDVALKVMLRGEVAGDAVRRFVRECEITARLPHPGIPPVHALGHLANGSPFLAMKLIRGRTLAELLKERERPADDLPRWVLVFEQICQAVGFAHAQGFIHRDLKPLNVMVGAFGEVQVMDWGLARETRSGEGEGRSERRESVPVQLSELSTQNSGATATGSILGTPAYMPPEQANGELDRLGPWSDVFALGGILCEILTARPTYSGKTLQTTLLLASRCELEDAFARLDACPADPELTDLCKMCLATDPAERPADAGAVAEMVAMYRAGVEERLRDAEQRRAADRAKAIEERKRQRVIRVLMVAVVLLISGGITFAWWRNQQAAERKAEQDRAAAELKQQEERVRGGVTASLNMAGELRKQFKFPAALTALQQASTLLAGGGAEDLSAVVEQARRDTEFAAELDTIRLKRSVYQTTPASEPQPPGDPLFGTAIRSIDARQFNAPAAYRKAFKAHGLDVVDNSVLPSVLAAKIARSPIARELLNALDDWAVTEPDALLRDRILAVTRAADPGPWMNRFRDPTVRDDPDALKQLATEADVARTPAATLAALALVLRQKEVDRPVLAAFVERAQTAHPSDFWLAFEVSRAIGAKDIQRTIGFLRVARAARPDNPYPLIVLGMAHMAAAEKEASLAALREAARVAPDCEEAHFALGAYLMATGDTSGGEAAFRDALRLNPHLWPGRLALATLAQLRGERDAALTLLREGVRIDPFNAAAHHALAEMLRTTDTAAAVLHAREAARLAPENPAFHYELGRALEQFPDPKGAMTAFRDAITRDSSHAEAWHALGTLAQQLGNKTEAIDALRRAAALRPKAAPWHGSLGVALLKSGDYSGAVEAFQAALALDPKQVAYLRGLALGKLLSGDRVAAIAAIRKALEIAPDDAELKKDLADFLRGADAPKKDDLAELRKAADANPDDPEATFRYSTALAGARKLAEGVPYLEAAVQRHPKHAGLHTNLGLGYLELRRYGDAARSIEKAVELEPKSWYANMQFGLALLIEGKRIPAGVQALERAIEYNPNCLTAGTRTDAANVVLVIGRPKNILATAAERTLCRRRALEWLKADLAGWEKLTAAEPGLAPAARTRLDDWLKAPRFADVRGSALSALPEAEATEWKTFWTEVDTFREKLGEK